MDENLTIFLNFNGDCGDAMEFYAKTFKATPGRVMKYSDAPGDRYPDYGDKIMYGEMQIADINVMFCDVPPDGRFVPGNNFVMNYSSTDFDKLHIVFDALKDGGVVGMEMQKTFFSELYGMVTDKFGITWNVMG